ncbi:hypothetical protein POJ06DRAFT_262411 [Lipomyces tetrasporus]|uniref:SRR1-like domain-containing protein n=1 Tax=Lipomyces tetrasporus TaxID=54092 RepID=A0AAD7QL54_9ASCO|nr:uncharacterized protein POJ06DRAFT_262411 [Lipomyces tetrasporus]KAJ8097053.1 hypothetical protein POJ06DRAFT_262411 [Lipomyces tetrasporus]
MRQLTTPSILHSANAELLSYSRELDSDALASARSFTTVRYPSKSSSKTTESRGKSNRRRKAQSSKYKVAPERTADDHIGSIPHKLDILKRQGKFYGALFGSHVERGVLFRAVGSSNAAQDIRGTKDTNNCQRHEIKYIRCLAIGRVSESDISRMQLAVLLALRNELGVSATDVTCYDPDFVPMDYDILRGFNIDVMQEPGEGEEKDMPNEELVQRRSETLYYMPHAPIFLVDRIMGLEGVQYVLGNDVMGYKERLEEELELVFASLKRVVISCDKTSDNDDDEATTKQNVSDPEWFRLRLEDGLARDESWWLSVNDMAMHWRRSRN